MAVQRPAHHPPHGRNDGTEKLRFLQRSHVKPNSSDAKGPLVLARTAAKPQPNVVAEGTRDPEDELLVSDRTLRSPKTNRLPRYQPRPNFQSQQQLHPIGVGKRNNHRLLTPGLL